MTRDELPQAHYTWITDSQELDCVCAFLGITQARDQITAALVEIVDGDYGFVYLTEGTNFKRSLHWDWKAWHYYVDEVPEELAFPIVQDDREFNDDYGV